MASKMEELLEAISHKDFEKVRAKLREIEGINDTSEGVTALEMAVSSNSIEMVQLLLENGADVMKRGTLQFERNILKYTLRCYTLNEDMVRLLLSAGADPYETFERWDGKENGFTSLIQNDPVYDSDATRHKEWKAGRLKILQTFLNHDNGIGEPETKGPYVLNAAARLGDANLVKRYLDDGVRLERCNELGLYPLLKACKNGDFGTAALLLEGGANPDESPKRPSEAPLRLAMDDGNIDLVRLLLDRGADYAGMPIHDEFTMHQCDDRLTGLMYACAWGKLDMVKECLSRGKDVNVMNEEGRSALRYCSDQFRCFTFCPRVDGETNLAIIGELLKAGARCDVQIDYEDSLLEDFLCGVIVQHDYMTSNISGITAPALMMKAWGICSQPLSPFTAVLGEYLKASNKQRKKIFKHEKAFDNFDCIFKLVILCGNKPTQEFIGKYKEVMLIATGREDGAHWLDDIALRGYSLKQLSRIKLRQLIRQPLVKNAMSDSVPLPTLLKRYILFDEVLPF